MKKVFSLSLFAVCLLAVSSQNLMAQQPDLCIKEIEIKCKNQRLLVITIQNLGNKLSEPTLVRIRPTKGDDPTQRCIFKAMDNVPQIQPGKEVTIRVPLKTHSGCDCSQGMQFEVLVDPKNYVEESDETNNMKTCNN